MIRVKLQYRLGNQMFQYAYAYAASQRLHTSFCLDTASHGNYLKQYFHLSPWWRNWQHQLYTANGYQKIKQTGHDKPSDVLQREANAHYYEGYFQSAALFQEYRSDLLDQFQIKKKYREKFRRQYGTFFKAHKTMVLHVRRTDYLQHGSEHTGGPDISLPAKYYHKCLADGDYSSYEKFVIGDDPEYMKREFGYLENVHFDTNPEIIDFQLMLQADVVVTANSSFSWWGAWLNEMPHKVIYAPKYWFGFRVKKEYPVGVIPEDWIKVDF